MKRCLFGALAIGLIVCGVRTGVGQVTVIGKDPKDKVLPGFYGQQGNAGTTIQGLNLNAGTNRLNPWILNLLPLSLVNVVDWGADPSGVTNSTTAMQAAIDYAVSVGAKVYVPGTGPGGYYKITSQLTGADNLWVVGDGWGSQIRQTDTGNSGKNVMKFTGKTNFTVSGIHFRASGASTTSISDYDSSYCGMVLHTCTNGLVQNCYFTGSAYYQLFNYKSDYTVIRDNYATDFGTADPYVTQLQSVGIACVDSVGVEISRNRVVGNGPYYPAIGISTHGGLTGR